MRCSTGRQLRSLLRRRPPPAARMAKTSVEEAEAEKVEAADGDEAGELAQRLGSAAQRRHRPNASAWPALASVECRAASSCARAHLCHCLHECVCVCACALVPVRA
jgi:hypothetical protein